MDTVNVLGDLVLFSTPFPIMPGFTFNQYLLDTDEPVLFHTGSVDLFEPLIAGLKGRLGDKPLSYVFVSHFESDECGAIVPLLKHYPHARVICSAVTARQFTGFGIECDPLVVSPGDVLEAKGARLRFMGYPSEMHLWEGLLAFEEGRGILFGSDLLMYHGPGIGYVVDADARAVADMVTIERVPSPAGLESVRRGLEGLPLGYVASGHGPVMRVV